MKVEKITISTGNLHNGTVKVKMAFLVDMGGTWSELKKIDVCAPTEHGSASAQVPSHSWGGAWSMIDVLRNLIGTISGNHNHGAGSHGGHGAKHTDHHAAKNVGGPCSDHSTNTHQNSVYTVFKC